MPHFWSVLPEWGFRGSDIELEGDERLHRLGGGSAVEVEIRRIQVRPDFVLKDHYINPGKWQPLLYNFRHYFGLGEELGSTFRHPQTRLSRPLAAC